MTSLQLGERWAEGRAALKEQRKSLVRQHILNAAAKLFAERGYRATTLDDIANAVGFTKPAVYYYFKNKQTILWHIFETIYDTYVHAAETLVEADLPPAEKMARLIHQHVLNVIEHRDWTAIFFREESELPDRQRSLILKRKREYDALLERVYSEGVRAGRFRDLPPHVAVSGIIGLCNWLYMWYDPRGPVKPEEVARDYVALLAHGYLLAADA